jgi:hypothetical protein
MEITDVSKCNNLRIKFLQKYQAIRLPARTYNYLVGLSKFGLYSQNENFFAACVRLQGLFAVFCSSKYLNYPVL